MIWRPSSPISEFVIFFIFLFFFCFEELQMPCFCSGHLLCVFVSYCLACIYILSPCLKTWCIAVSVSVAFSLTLASPSCKLLHYSVTLSQVSVDDAYVRAIGMSSSYFILPREYMENITGQWKFNCCHQSKIIRLVSVLQQHWESVCSLVSYALSGAVIMNKSFRLGASSTEHANTDLTWAIRPRLLEVQSQVTDAPETSSPLHLTQVFVSQHLSQHTLKYSSAIHSTLRCMAYSVSSHCLAPHNREQPLFIHSCSYVQ